jgi:fatty acid desaturase/putative flippase GtrA
MPAESMHRMMRQTVVYIAIGGLTALLYLAVALTATVVFGIAPRWASLAGFVAALPFSYLGHKLLTFRSKGTHRDELPRFIVGAGVGLLISGIVPELVVRQWHAPPWAGYLVACVAVPALNYTLLWLWVFVGRRNPAPGEAAPDPTDASRAMVVHTQKYRPYRSSLLGGGQLRNLNRLRPARAACDTIALWLQIVIPWTAVAVWPSWWLIALAIPIVGTRYYALYIIGHDGLHRRLFATVRTNDLWNDLAILGAIGAITRLNRVNHMRHHATLALPDDPDRYKYIAGNKATRLSFGLALTGLPYVLNAVGNVFLRKRRKHARPDPAAGYTARDLVILGLWQVALIGGLSSAVGWWAYPVLWLVPVYAFTYAADIIRVFLEHSMPGGDDDADATMRLVTYRSSAIERRLFAPMNMNFHTAHHLWPSIPYYNLPEADRLIRQSPMLDGGLVWRGSYFAYLWEYARRLPWLPGAVRADRAEEQQVGSR